MAATVEAPTPARGRDKLTLLRRTLQERVEELVKARADIARLEIVEREEVAKAARSAPTKRIFSMGTPAQRARQRREKLEASIPSLEIEISELATVVEEEESAHFAVVLDEARLRAGRLRKEELEAWAKAAEALVQMHECWSEIVEKAEELDALCTEVRHSDAAMHPKNAEAMRAFMSSSRPAVNPFPFGFEEYLVKLARIASGFYEVNDLRADGENRLATIVPRFTPRTPELRPDRIDRG